MKKKQNTKELKVKMIKDLKLASKKKRLSVDGIHDEEQRRFLCLGVTLGAFSSRAWIKSEVLTVRQIKVF